MEFDFSDGAHHPDAPRHAVGSHNHHGQGAQIELPKRLTRYLPADSRDAFIGSLLSSTAETVRLIKKECPSLAHVAEKDIALQLRFDGDTQKVVKNVLFRVLPGAWPSAVSDVLPLVHVSVKRDTSAMQHHATANATPNPLLPRDLKEPTWEDLRREGVLLGVRGWTDRPTGFGPNSESRKYV
ncbi:hypothetical protein DB88DRAFT_444579 [Papiliotrema laurentii]|nr:hypothetical protein DB88DRAFT_444579 [Papiliotrema laurentii]